MPAWRRNYGWPLQAIVVRPRVQPRCELCRTELVPGTPNEWILKGYWTWLCFECLPARVKARRLAAGQPEPTPQQEALF